MSGVELSEVIADLRANLAAAQKEGDGKSLRFTIEDIEVELQMVVTKEISAEAGVKTAVKFWVLSGEANAKADAKFNTAATQKIKLKMKMADILGPDGQVIPSAKNISHIGPQN